LWGPVLAVLLLPLLACPPTSIPTPDHDGGHYLASPYGVRELEPTPTAPRSAPSAETSLPLWDLDASLTEVERLLALDDPPTWAPWVAWSLARATQHGDAYLHLLDALASSKLSAEHLAWWRSITPDPTVALRDALASATAARTRALLTTALALTEYSNSCPVAVDVDGACRAPGTKLLLRRSTIALERAREHTKLARKHWSKVDVDGADLATRALWAELELAVMITDYDELLDLDAPEDLWFVVEDWRHGSGVPAWEDEYRRQLARAEESKARYHALVESAMECGKTQLDGHGRLLWIDTRSSGVALLRQARILASFANMIGAAEEREDRHISGPTSSRRWHYVCSRQSDALYVQADTYLDLCTEIASLAGDIPLDQACRASLWELDHYDEPPLVEFIVEPRASTTMHRSGVVGL
jgi:hypothetical protein